VVFPTPPFSFKIAIIIGFTRESKMCDNTIALWHHSAITQ
jgi:hypothetical protein